MNPRTWFRPGSTAGGQLSWKEGGVSSLLEGPVEMIQPHWDRIFLSLKKEGNFDTGYNIDEL